MYDLDITTWWAELRLQSEILLTAVYDARFLNHCAVIPTHDASWRSSVTDGSSDRAGIAGVSGQQRCVAHPATARG